MNILTHTIAAISTPPGKGGVAIIRMSGDSALSIAGEVFRSASGKAISEYAPRTQVYGYIHDADGVLDDVLLTYFPAPHSYTGEPTVEIGCHGGILITHTVLQLLLAHGATAAGAGEFTRRAFINGRLSLTEAEAIGNLLEARSREQIRLASRDSRSLLSERIEAIRAGLVTLMSSIYARIDYPDEDLGDFTDGELAEALADAEKSIADLLATYPTGRAISEGIGTVICGKPNAGKSSLYNLLHGAEKAIVTDIEGTTRDVLESTVPLGRVMLRVADTAGIRSGDDLDAVERIGIRKSREMIAKCELLFAIFDISEPFDEKDEELIREIQGSSAVKLAILNKSDKGAEFDTERLAGVFTDILTVSVKSEPEAALRSISSTVNRLFTDEKITVGESAVLSSARQAAALERARGFVKAAIDGLALGFAQDAVSGDVERAIDALSELTGRSVREDVVADIFSKFCVGK